MDKKIILLTNDDGIEAKGLLVLYNTLKEDKKFNIKVVAPDKERSSVGHAITVFDPISVKKEYRDGKLYGYAVNGTPADCVKLAIAAILDKRPDILVSGINRGANLGGNVIYSGTVSAATEGTIYDVPSIAVSINSLKDVDYSYTAKFAKKIVNLVLSKGLPEGTLLNINMPDVSEDKIKGVKVTCQSNAKFKDIFLKRISPRGRVYYWMDGKMDEKFAKNTKNEDDDYTAIKNNYISITPIHHDMTNYKEIEHFKNWNWKVSKDK